MGIVPGSLPPPGPPQYSKNRRDEAASQARHAANACIRAASFCAKKGRHLIESMDSEVPVGNLDGWWLGDPTKPSRSGLATPEGGGTSEQGRHSRELYRTGGWSAIWRTHAQRSSTRSAIWGLIFLDRKEEVLNRLEELEKRQDSWMLALEDPIYDSLRQEPRFKALLRRVGYPPSVWQ